MENPKSFHYLNQSDCFELDGVDDAHEYLATRRAMDIVGISEQEQVENYCHGKLSLSKTFPWIFLYYIAESTIYRKRYSGS